MTGKTGLLSPLFLKYQAEYEKNPKSRVFAPLAEMYRKIGMLDRAMEILGAGVRHHPKYVLGYLGMAHCYYDLQQFSLVYSTLKPFLDTNRDNLRLQKLFADSCYRLDKKEEALNTYKYLLFMQPRDKEVAELVLSLEKELENLYKPIHKPIAISDSNILNEDRSLKNALDGIDDAVDSWIQLPINETSKSNVVTNTSDDNQAWEMQKNQPVYLEFQEKEEKESLSFNITESQKMQSATTSPPIITHTLVDLYIGQGHIEKALELLEKILLLNPNDERTHQKILEINQLLTVDLKDEELVDTNIEIHSPEASEELIEIDEILNISRLDHQPASEDKKIEPIHFKDEVEQSVVINITEDDGHKVLMDEISQIKIDPLLVNSLSGISNAINEKPKKQEVGKKNSGKDIFIKQELILNSFLNKIKMRAEKFKSL